MNRCIIALYCLIASIIALSIDIASAQSITVLKDLDFGEAVVTNNAMQHSINVQSNGNFSADSAFVFLKDPTEGLYVVRDLPPSVQITGISVTVDQQMMGQGEGFFIDNFDISSAAYSNSIGELEVYVGGRLRTTGSNQNYLHDATFNSSLTLTINY